MTKNDFLQVLTVWFVVLEIVCIFIGWTTTEVKYVFEAPIQKEASAMTETVEEPLSESDKLRRYILKVFGEEAGSRGLKMLETCENSKLNPTAINWNKNGTWDYGVWQINQIHGYTQEELSDPYFNTRVAHKIYKAWGNTFSAWTCSEVVGEVPFYKR